MGDRHQLSAVGRGGVPDLAARWVDSDAYHTLETVHRFTHETMAADGQLEVVPDVEYAQLSLAMRTSENPTDVFAALLERGQIRLYDTDASRLAALADLAATDIRDGGRALVVADTRDQVSELNTAIRDRLVTAGLVDNTHAITTGAGHRIGIGGRIVTRHNDTTLDVANRDIWTVTGIDADGSITSAVNPVTSTVTATQALVNPAPRARAMVTPAFESCRPTTSLRMSSWVTPPRCTWSKATPRTPVTSCWVSTPAPTRPMSG
ncbi:hypothetical protein [uncultured Jatrophihabitans sp.]|uniref:hypothetical protein n=1 Tax=uncultured Jatrophihabitans sp. TaxID=1610747 RepID=UPI0035CBB2FB